MFNYKKDQTQYLQSIEKKTWHLDKGETENQNINLLCPSQLSDSFIQKMKDGISPLNEIKTNFNGNVPIFDANFFNAFDHFINDHQTEGMTLLEFIFNQNINNIANFYGKYSIPIIFNHLPSSFLILAFLFTNPLPLMASHKIYSIDFVSFFLPFIENTDFHLILSIIFKSIEPLKINKSTIPTFFKTCELLLNSPNKNATINILFGFQDHFYQHFAMEIASILSGNFNNLILNNKIGKEDSNENKIIQLILMAFSKVVTDETINIIISSNNPIFQFLASSLSSTDEHIVIAASEFALSLVSYPQAYSFLTSSDIIRLIFKLASESLLSTRKNMILILCDLIRLNKEINTIFLANGVLNLFIDFLGLDQNMNTYEIIEAIQYLSESAVNAEQIDYIANIIIENKPLFDQLADSECKSISNIAQSILRNIENYTL